MQQTRTADDHGHDVGRERELIERAAHLEGSVLTAEEREMVFGAILRVSRSAQRRSAAAREAEAAAARDTAADAATQDTAAGPASSTPR